MQTDTYETALENVKQELQKLLTEFRQRITEGEGRRAQESFEAFEQDILARQERCTQEFDSGMERIAQLIAKSPHQAKLHERTEQSMRRQYLRSMNFFSDMLRERIAQL